MSRQVLSTTDMSTRQVLAQGRCYEKITHRPIMDFAAVLSYRHSGGEGTYHTALALRSAGYFALHLDPSSTLPDLPDHADITLTLTLMHALFPPVTAQINVPSAALAVVEKKFSENDQAFKVPWIAGAPFIFDMAIAPTPILLDGLLLRNNDPDDPAAGVAVSIEGFAGYEVQDTDSEGRFRITALPISETVTLQFSDKGNVTRRTLRPAWGSGSMAKTFSIASS